MKLTLAALAWGGGSAAAHSAKAAVSEAEFVRSFYNELAANSDLLTAGGYYKVVAIPLTGGPNPDAAWTAENALRDLEEARVALEPKLPPRGHERPRYSRQNAIRGVESPLLPLVLSDNPDLNDFHSVSDAADLYPDNLPLQMLAEIEADLKEGVQKLTAHADGKRPSLELCDEVLQLEDKALSSVRLEQLWGSSTPLTILLAVSQSVACFSEAGELPLAALVALVASPVEATEMLVVVQTAHFSLPVDTTLVPAALQDATVASSEANAAVGSERQSPSGPQVPLNGIAIVPTLSVSSSESTSPNNDATLSSTGTNIVVVTPALVSTGVVELPDGEMRRRLQSEELPPLPESPTNPVPRATPISYQEAERRHIFLWVSIFGGIAIYTALYTVAYMPLHKDPLLYTKIYAGAGGPGGGEWNAQ